MDLQLAGRTAIVTGGSRGIGKAIALALAREGAKLIVVARDPQALADSAAELAAETEAEVTAIPADTGSDDSVRAMVARAVEQVGVIDILVNAAAQPGGQAPPPKLADITDGHLWPEINVKVLGYLRCIREVVPHMPAGGRIINISGLAARLTGSTVGSIRNVAVAAMTKNLADELSPLRISAVVVHPGAPRTERTADMLKAAAAREATSASEIEARLAAKNLLGRLVDASEVADVVAFLASPKAVAINGDAIAVGGGVPGVIYY